MGEIRSKLTIKTPERRHWPLLTLNKEMSAGFLLCWSSTPFSCSLQLPSVHKLSHGPFTRNTSELSNTYSANTWEQFLYKQLFAGVPQNTCCYPRNLQEDTCARVYLLIKLQAAGLQLHNFCLLPQRPFKRARGIRIPLCGNSVCILPMSSERIGIF